MDEETAQISEGGTRFFPKSLLAVGEKRTVKGAAKDPYIQKRRAAGFYSCTCPSWRNLATSESSRTCTHLRALLGDDYEAARVRQANTSSASTSKSRVTGQKRKEQLTSTSGRTAELDTDTFPYAESASLLRQAKKARTLQGSFNERRNGGPRDMNGASPLLLAHKWPETKDPTGFWLSEKLDGVRAWWNGERMYARSGRAWNPPQWFLDRLPKDMHLDGELWAKRDAFDATSGICRRSDSDGWRTINFMAFDVTNLPLLYEERLQELKKRLIDGEKTPDEVQDGRLGGLICVLPAVRCDSKTHFDRLMQQIVDKGGEGLMLREARSAYEVGRSRTLYKHKFWYDAEGLVVGHEWGQGEHKGRMGAARVRMESGHIISVGSGFSHAQRDSFQPPVGTVVRYRFQELSHDGFPRFPIYEGTCPDKSVSRDAIVRSTKFRAEARTEELKRFFATVDERSEGSSVLQ